MSKLHLGRAVVVEGRYDKIRLSNLTDALIVTTDGFGIFNDREQQRFIHKLAAERGLIILTDSDAAGFKIRAFVKQIAAPGSVTDVYVPDVHGKERRKTEPSKEGKLGVEGLPDEVIIEAIKRAGLLTDDELAARSEPLKQKERYTTADLYSMGLTGGADSAERRREFLRARGLPERMSVSALLKYLNNAGEEPENL